MALAAVWTHRFRSLLTILGIVIGITTVVTVASLLTGLRKGVVTFFQELGPDNIFVYQTSGDPSIGRRPKRSEAAPTDAAGVRRTDPAAGAPSVLEDVGLAACISRRWSDGNPMTARVPGYESDNVNAGRGRHPTRSTFHRGTWPPGGSSRRRKTRGASMWP